MDNFFSYPAPSRGSRPVPRRGRGSARVQVVDTRAPLAQHRILSLESGLEASCFDQLVAMPDVLDILDQPPAVSYRDSTGRWRTHTFDFLVQLRCGQKIAIAVRPADRAHKQRFAHTLQLIASQLSRNFADWVVLFTDHHIQRPSIVHFAPATLLIERATELGAPTFHPVQTRIQAYEINHETRKYLEPRPLHRGWPGILPRRES